MLLAPVDAAIRSASAAACSAVSLSPRMPAIVELTMSPPAFQSGWRSSAARDHASSAAGIATSQSVSRAATIPWIASMYAR